MSCEHSQSYQKGILAPVPNFAKFITYTLTSVDNLGQCLAQLALRCDGESVVLALSANLVAKISAGANIPGLKAMPEFSHNGLSLTQDQADLLIWLRSNGDGASIGDLAQKALSIDLLLQPNFALHSSVDCFNYNNRDLSGYEDGTENPEGDKAIETAFLQHENPELNGSSFLVIQNWLHNLKEFKQRSQAEQDDTIGRRLSDNEEFDEAPESAHVKRTAQESFDPEAFILRRSMPWVNGNENGLIFAAFAASFDPFEAIVQRMIGVEDGLVDNLFSFTKPQGGGYYWCPPVSEGRVNLSAIIAR
ncbi:Dyp-type peroxidase [Sessilibacter sp. MAH1]